MPRNPLVIIVDDDVARRAEIHAMLAPARLAVVGDCGYGVEAAALAEEIRPDVVLVSVAEPAARAAQTIESVRSICPGTSVIAYTSTTDFAVVRLVMQAGARDIVAMPVKPAELLASIERALRANEEVEIGAAPIRPAGSILTVFGAKGGIGKTTLSTNLGAAIARDTGTSVLVIDLDTRFGDVALMLDIEPRFTVSDLASNAATLDRETIKSAVVRHPSGVHVLPAPRHPNEWRNVTADEIKALVRMSARVFDYVILDTPGVFNDIVGTAIEVATHVLVVTTVDMASIKDTSLMLDLLEAESFPTDRLFITVNHANGANSITASDIQRILHKEIFWEVPHDDAVSLATQMGKPVVLAKPRSPAAKSIAGMATKITGSRSEAPAPQRGFVRRLFALGAAN